MDKQLDIYNVIKIPFEIRYIIVFVSLIFYQMNNLLVNCLVTNGILFIFHDFSD